MCLIIAVCVLNADEISECIKNIKEHNPIYRAKKPKTERGALHFSIFEITTDSNFCRRWKDLKGFVGNPLCLPDIAGFIIAV
mmetsp:Transcript_912/g.1880  ORF Transcript_912/g.1880 Transcript_912/m.1880 type:complete len:82 (-) Transcript_912:655-900(-)